VIVFGAGLVLSLLIQPAQPSLTLRAAVERLTTSTSNEQRFEAMTALLRARNIPFTVERVTIAQAVGAEPRTEGRNIVASFGTGAAQTVVGAHYDAARIPGGALSRGAVDNAASSVVLLQLADAFRSQPPAGRVTLVWFDMEEIGLVGSSKYVEAHRADRITAMINLDVNAYGDTVIFGASHGRENAAARQALLETCAALDATCLGFAQMPAGDDRPFASAGIPSLSLAILPEQEAHQLWLMMGGPQAGLSKETIPPILKTLHTVDDVIEKVDTIAVARVAVFTSDLIKRLAR